MVAYFLDTSAIVKRYIAEPGQSLLLEICNPKQGNDLYISQAALVEVVASICRKGHEKSITMDERDKVIATFRQDTLEGYDVRAVTTETYTKAGDLCRVHRLRAYDAVQLACALHLRDETRKKKLPDPILVCADNNLLSIASAEGLDIDNPNSYPQIKNANPT